MGINRKEFLKVFGLGGAGLVLPGTSLVAGSELLSKPVKIYDNYIKGVEHYELGKCLKRIKIGDPVVLKRFQDHRYDRFAIGVQWEVFFWPISQPSKISYWRI